MSIGTIRLFFRSSLDENGVEQPASWVTEDPRDRIVALLKKVEGVSLKKETLNGEWESYHSGYTRCT